MPEKSTRRAQELTPACDVFLVVYPAAALPALAKQNGAALVIVNREPTPLDDLADLVIRADTGAVLAPFIVRN